MPAAVPGVLKRPTWLSGWLMCARVIWAWTPPRSGVAILFRWMRFLTKPLWSSVMTVATIRQHWIRPWNWRITRALRVGRQRQDHAVNCAASVFLPTSRPAVSRPRRRWVNSGLVLVYGKVPRCDSIPPAMYRFLPVLTHTDRVMRPHSRSWLMIS